VKQYDKAASSCERVLPFAQNNSTLLYNAACAHSLSGNKERALELLGRAVENGFKDKAGMSSDPDLGASRDQRPGLLKKWDRVAPGDGATSGRDRRITRRPSTRSRTCAP
jgi:hypothetical protein